MKTKNESAATHARRRAAAIKRWRVNPPFRGFGFSRAVSEGVRGSAKFAQHIESYTGSAKASDAARRAWATKRARYGKGSGKRRASSRGSK